MYSRLCLRVYGRCFAYDGEAVDGRNMSNGCVHLIDPGSDVLQRFTPFYFTCMVLHSVC